VSDGLAVARAAKPYVTGLGGAFMTSEEAKAAGKEGGYRGWGLYFAGRGGVLGPAPVEVVVAAFGFHAPDLVQHGWATGLAVRPVAETVTRYAAVCHAWGRHRWSALAGVERLADLAARVLDVADSTSWPLYAGWCAVPLPDDPPARAAHLLHVLREHRGGAHGSALRVEGLTPLEAIVSGPGGPANATFFGWSQDQVAATRVDDAVGSRRARAEELTDALVAPAYAALAPAEADELVALLGAAEAATAR
jgi:hypothetical protein